MIRARVRRFAIQSRDEQQGQILVLFALSAVAIIAMVGLVLDGGSTFAQRRSQQNAADNAALAGANDYLINRDATLATNRAKLVSSLNGYADASSGKTVTVAIDTSNGVALTVNIGAPHQNSFASVVGMSSWNVSTTATAIAGYPNRVNGAAPLQMSRDDFGVNGAPYSQYADPNHPFTWDLCQGSDAPQGPGETQWTDYGYPSNLNDNVVQDIISGTRVINITLNYGADISQHNNGCRANLPDLLNAASAGLELAVPVVDHNGIFQGWATFHLVSAQHSGNAKSITGYFKSSFQNPTLTIVSGGGGTSQYLGSYVLKLTN